MAECAALILAGGRGVRLGTETPKQYLPLAGRPVLRHAVEAFLSHPRIAAVRVVIGETDRDLYAAATAGLDLLPPVTGGATRQDSGFLGLESLVEAAPETVLIHDAARPFVDASLIDRVLGALAAAPAALPGVVVADTLKRQTGTPPMVGETVDRAGLWRAQTPQGFRFADILAAHRDVRRAGDGSGLTDDAAVAQRAGLPVALVDGSEDNFKITTAEDLRRAERMAAGMTGTVRLGTGFDVHRFGDGSAVTLCGVDIPHDRGLAGHSDADVAMHALTDALLGAIADGDIGAHFPPSDERWRGAASHVFLRHAADLIARRGGAIVNVDLTIICEAPKIGPHREPMRRSLADILGIDVDRVSVKATTTEQLGFTGRGEGIAAQAAASVRLP